MKLISWNVNGLRACLGKGFMEFFSASGADILCLQETKMQQGQAEVPTEGYHQYWNSAEKKGYSGTVVFTKVEPLSVSYGIGIPEHDSEGRVITAEFDSFYLVNTYTPNSQRELVRLPYRMRWEEDFRAYLLALDAKKPVILCGDLNVAHQRIDIKNASSNVNNAGFTQQERDKMTELLAAGFVDTFRHFYPDRQGAYTWWSYFGNARANNSGWRLDYFITSRRFTEQLADSEILPEVMGSDHCPVVLTLK